MYRKQRILPVVILITVLPAVSTLAQESNAEKVEKLKLELADVQAQLVEMQQSVSNQAKRMWQRQHELEYQDNEAAQLRQEIKALEKDLIEKRKALKERLNRKSEFREMEKRRKEMYRALRELRETEKDILNEISLFEGAKTNP